MDINNSSQNSTQSTGRVFPRSTVSQQQDAVQSTHDRLNRFSSSNSLRDLLVRLIQNLLAQLGKEQPKNDPNPRPVYGAPIVQPPKDDQNPRPVYGAPIVQPPKDEPIARPVYGAPLINQK